MIDCIFCKIVDGSLPSHKIWEDEKHLAFLNIYPNTEGSSLVIPKEHYSSYIFDLSDDVIKDLILATKSVAKLLDAKLEDVGRTALVFEGFEINHIHSKLYPLHGTKRGDWQPINSNVQEYFDKYEGYVSSRNGKRADDEALRKLAEKIRK